MSELTSDNLHDVVSKLVGPIRPIGETREDGRRFANLQLLTELIDKLVIDVDEVGTENKGRPEHSRDKAGRHASGFLADLGIEE